jgi:hypothetical protein
MLGQVCCGCYSVRFPCSPISIDQIHTTKYVWDEQIKDDALSKKDWTFMGSVVVGYLIKLTTNIGVLSNRAALVGG